MAEDSDVTTEDVTTEDEGGGFPKVLLLVALIAIGSFLLKKKREQELDEALWEEPQAL